jgi:hypothetical protein
MKEKYVKYRDYVETLVVKSVGDAIETVIAGAMLMFIVMLLSNRYRELSVQIHILVRMLFTVFFSSFGIRNARNLKNGFVQFLVYTIAGLYCLTSAATVVIDFIS